LATTRVFLFASALFAASFSNAASAQAISTVQVSGQQNPRTSIAQPKQLPVSSLKIVSGNNQSATFGVMFVPLVVQAGVNGPPPSGVPVQFAVASGPVTLTLASVTTDVDGVAEVTATAGSTPGPATVVATVGRLSVAFHLTVLPPRTNLSPANFVNGAGFFATGDKNSGALSPCSIGTLVFGDPQTEVSPPDAPNLFSTAIPNRSGPNSAIFQGISFNSEAAPILNIATDAGNSVQALITFQVPCDVTPGSVPVSLTLVNASSIPYPPFLTFSTTVEVRSASPGIYEAPMSDGIRRVVGFRPDGTFVSLENPARRGEIIRIYITGIGPTSPPLTTKALPTPGVDSISTAAYVAMVLGDSFHEVAVLSSSRAAPSLIGVYEITFQVPADAPTGNNVFLEVGVLVTNPGDYQFAQPNVGSKIPIQ